MNRWALAFLAAAAAAAAGCSAESTPGTLGWLDDATISTADMVRISQIAKGGAGHTYQFNGQDEATANRGNLKVVKCFEDGSSKPRGIVLAEHGTPIKPPPPPEPPRCGSVIMPGQTCSFR